ncbi:hypothetical protein ACIOYT_32215 [Streptomyces halstedii]|uniref:hypothetical protein n=1 Tax=Streptomyces halstedii TaxID=1944 RepID=UPI00382067B9
MPLISDDLLVRTRRRPRDAAARACARRGAGGLGAAVLPATVLGPAVTGHRARSGGDRALRSGRR